MVIDFATVRAESHATAAEFVKSCDPALWRFPRPVEEMAAYHGLRVLEAPGNINLEHGMIMGTVILIARQRKPWEKRLTVAHELGHFVLGNAVGVAEAECTQFGSALLMPRDDVVAQAHQQLGSGAPFAASQLGCLERRHGVMSRLVRRYGVGYKALIWAMADYGLLRDVPAWHAIEHIDRLMDDYMVQVRGPATCSEVQRVVSQVPTMKKEEAGTVKECPNCGAEARHEDALFCWKCSKSLDENMCTSCSTILAADEGYCYLCGHESTYLRDSIGKFAPDEIPF